MLNRQKGFIHTMLLGLIGPWIYLVYAAAIAIAVYTAYKWVDTSWQTSAGIEEGERRKKAEWDVANVNAQKAQDDQKARDQSVINYLWKEIEHAKKQASRYSDDLAAQARAWEREKTAFSNTDCSKVSGGQPATFLTWAFVGLYDGAHTGPGISGQPLFGHPAAIAAQGASPASSSPYGLKDLEPVHRENASRHNECRRDLNNLMDTIEKLQKEPRIAK